MLENQAFRSNYTRTFRVTVTLPTELWRNIDVGISLFSHLVAKALFSAPQSLTSVFGMGTGGPSASSTPTFSRSASFSLNLLLFSVQTEILFKSSETYVKQTLLMNNIYPLFFEHSYKRDFGDSCGNRTRVAGVRGRSLNRLTNEPFI